LSEVVDLLGNPNKEYHRSESMVLNYLELGLDIVIDSTDFTVRKIIMNTNNPKMPNFCFYERCFFELKVTKSSYIKQLIPDISKSPQSKPKQNENEIERNGNTPPKREESCIEKDMAGSSHN
jgi:hypothetical protein